MNVKEFTEKNKGKLTAGSIGIPGIIVAVIMNFQAISYELRVWFGINDASAVGEKVKIEQTKPEGMKQAEFIKLQEMYDLDQFASGIDEKDFEPTSHNKQQNPAKESK